MFLERNNRITSTSRTNIDCRFDVSALIIIGITWHPPAGFQRLRIASENGDPVLALLPVPNGSVTRIHNRIGREFAADGLQFLKANNIRFRLLQPLEEYGQPPIDSVDIVNGDFNQ